MHWQALQFVNIIKSKFPGYFIDTSVLEIGSHSVNGSVRQLFNTGNYTGVDLSPGKGVDTVTSGHEFQSQNRFDVVISCECFEHNPFYAETFTNMIAHLSNEGIIIFTCASTGRPEHGTSNTDPSMSPGTSALKWDYYRNLVESDFSELIKGLAYCTFLENKSSNDLYFIGTKSQSIGALIEKELEFFKNSVAYFEQISFIPKSYFENIVIMMDVEFTPECLFFLYHSQQNTPILQNYYFRKAVDNAFLLNPNSAELLCILSEIATIEGNVCNALFLSKRAFNIRPTDFYSNKYADGLASLKRFSQAIEVLSAIPNVIENVNLAWKIAEFSLKAGQLEKSLEYIVTAVNKGGRTPVFLHKYMQVLFARNELALAKDVANEIICQDSCPDWIINDCRDVLRKQ